jgi:hypothetical protein
VLRQGRRQLPLLLLQAQAAVVRPADRKGQMMSYKNT